MPPGSWQQERSGLWSLRSKRQLLPIADLNADGDAIDWLTIPRDIVPTLSVLVGDDGQATHTVKTDTLGHLTTAGVPPSATTPPVYTGMYTQLLASLANQTITATVTGPTFDPRPYGTINCSLVVTAISGAGATITPFFQAQDPATSNWWSIALTTATTTVNATNTDGSFAAKTGSVWSPGTVNGRMGLATARIVWFVAGTTPSITLSAYVWGF